jgi:hypothetical protein
MRQGLDLSAICVGAALAAAACAGASNDQGASAFAESQAPDSGCAAFTRALCAHAIECEGEPYCTVDHCLAQSSCTGFNALAAALRGGAVTYDATAGGTCLARFAADPCGLGTLPRDPTVFDVLAACAGALTGRLPLGAACVATIECGAGLSCDGASLGCGGKCATQASAAPGSPCARYADCEVGPASLWCDTMAGVCAAGVDAGSGCGLLPAGITACAPGLWCDAVSSAAAGTCRSPGGAGSPCNDLGGCEASLHCEGYAPTAPDAGLGSCALPGDAGAACELSSDCAPGLVCVAGACGLPFGVGVRCNSDAYCAAGLTCATEKCLETKCPGDDCTDPNAWCVLGACRGGVCQTLAPAGAPCAAGGDCASGVCTGGVCVAAACAGQGS